MILLPFSYVEKRGWDSAHPAFSCKEILDSGHSKGDGEYWIDPEKSGNPLKVYCDMSRYGGKRMNFFLRHEDFNRSIFVRKSQSRSCHHYSYVKKFWLHECHQITWVRFILGCWLLVSNVKFGSPSPKVSVETSYRGISKSHMVLQKSVMKELRRRLFLTQLRPTSTATRNKDARST